MADTHDSTPDYTDPKYAHVIQAVDSAAAAADARGARPCTHCGSLGVVMVQHEGTIYSSPCPACA